MTKVKKAIGRYDAKHVYALRLRKESMFDRLSCIDIMLVITVPS